MGRWRRAALLPALLPAPEDPRLTPVSPSFLFCFKGGIRSAKSDVASSLARLSESVSLVERQTSQECAKLEKVRFEDAHPSGVPLLTPSQFSAARRGLSDDIPCFSPSMLQVLQAEIMSRQSGQEKLKVTTGDLGERLTALQQRLNTQAEELSGAIRVAQTTIKAEVAKNLGENNGSLTRWVLVTAMAACCFRFLLFLLLATLLSSLIVSVLLCLLTAP